MTNSRMRSELDQDDALTGVTTRICSASSHVELEHFKASTFQEIER